METTHPRRGCFLVYFLRRVVVWFNVATVNVGGSKGTVRCFGLLLRCSFPLHRHWLDDESPCPMKSRPCLCCVLKSITAMRCRLSSSPLFLITRLRVAAKQCQPSGVLVLVAPPHNPAVCAQTPSCTPCEDEEPAESWDWSGFLGGWSSCPSRIFLRSGLAVHT